MVNDGVISKSGPSSTDLGISSLVDQLLDRFQIWVSPCDVWLSNSQHVDGGLVQLDESSIVDLSKTQQLENFPWFRWYTIDTARIEILISL